MTSSPTWCATVPFLSSSAGTMEDAAGEMPRNSPAMPIVFAVNWPPQAPAPGLAEFSSSSRSASLILPTAWAPMPSKTSRIETSWPWKCPGAIEPL